MEDSKGNSEDISKKQSMHYEEPSLESMLGEEEDPPIKSESIAIVGDKNENKQLQEFSNIYTPTTILGVYSNSLRTPADCKIILLKGEFHPSLNGQEYAGYYYDDIKSPNENRFLKIKISSLLRSKLQTNFIYVFKGYMEKKISKSSIELIFVVDEVLQREENPISEEDIQRFKVIQKKVSKGYKDIEATIKEHIYNNKIFRVVNIYGTTGIVNQDFDAGIAEAKVRYEILECRCNLSSKTDIISVLRRYNLEAISAIAIVRGGGDRSSMEIFNSPDLGEEVMKLKPLFITALGHVANDSLIDKIADRKFHLPHDYGNKLKVWVDEALAEQARSKSVFIDQVKKDLTKTFEDQIKTKDEALLNLKKTYEENSNQMVKMATAELQTKFDTLKVENSRLNQQLSQASKGGNAFVWIVIGLIVGLIVGIMIAARS